MTTIEKRKHTEKALSPAGIDQKLSIKLSHLLSFVGSLPLSIKTSSLFILFIFHLILTIVHSDFVWVSSYGGLLTMFGIVLLFDYSLPEDEIRGVSPKKVVEKQGATYVSLSEGRSFSDIIPDEIGIKLLEVYEKAFSEHKKYILEKRLRVISSFTLTCLGTLLWAYASYLNLVFFPQDCT
jgi:hypothetical protein